MPALSASVEILPHKFARRRTAADASSIAVDGSCYRKLRPGQAYAAGGMDVFDDSLSGDRWRVSRLLPRQARTGGGFMARDQNTYAKRWREMDKKRKAEEKRARRQKKKELANQPAEAAEADDAEQTAPEE